MSFGESIRFVHLSDTHVTAGPYKETISRWSPLDGARALVDELKALPFTPDFVLHTGDVAYDARPEEYALARECFAEIGVPMHTLVGNHDDSETLQRELDAIQDLRPQYFREVDLGAARLILLDSKLSAAAGDEKDPVHGMLGDAQLEWVRSRIGVVGDIRPLIIAVHHNPLPVGAPWLDEWMGLRDGLELHALLASVSQRVRGVFFGHVHQNLDVVRDGILYASTLSSWCQFQGWPDQARTGAELDAEPGFSVVVVSDEQTFVRRHRFAGPANRPASKDGVEHG